jgi:hypothetical protein
VKLTLALRHNFFLLPFAVTLLALIFAVGVAGIGPDYFGRWLRGKEVKDQLKQNRKPGGIVGLDDDWVNATALDRKGNTLLRAIRDVRTLGPERADQARKRLTARLEKEPKERLPPEHPLRRAASYQAKRSKNEITDFLDATAKPITHPADNMIATLDRFDALCEALEKLAGHIDRTIGITNEKKEMLRGRLEEVRRFVAEAGDEPSITDAEALAEQVQQQVVNAAQPVVPGRTAARPPVAGRVADMGGTQVPIHHSRELPVAAPLLAGQVLTGPRVPERTIRTGRWWPSLTEDLAIFLAFVVLMAVAAISVAASDYFPTATFGSSGDYLKLFATALGTASASSILTTLFLWKPSAQD